MKTLMDIRLIEVLTDAEREEVFRLRKLIIESKFRHEIEEYNQKINSILDQAELRYKSQREQAAALA